MKMGGESAMPIFWVRPGNTRPLDILPFLWTSFDPDEGVPCRGRWWRRQLISNRYQGLSLQPFWTNENGSITEAVTFLDLTANVDDLIQIDNTRHL